MADIEAPKEVLSAKYNGATRQSHYPLEVFNTYKNWFLINLLQQHGTCKDLSELPRDKRPAIVLGSGPSLNTHISKFKEWEGAIFCSSSHGSTCVYHGRDPDYIVNLDPKVYWHEFAVDKWEGRKTKLITTTQVDSSVFENWPLPMYFYRKKEPNNNFYDCEEFIGYQWIRSQLLSYGSTIPTEVAIANVIGCNPIFLVGVDWGYPGDKSRFTSWLYKNGKWEEQIPAPVNGNCNTYYNGIKTDEICMYYKNAFVTEWKLDKPEVYSCSDGILLEVPHIDFDTVLECQGNYHREDYTHNNIDIIADKSLSFNNVYEVKFNNGGKRFLEELNANEKIDEIINFFGNSVEFDKEKNKYHILKMYEWAKNSKKRYVEWGDFE